QWPPKGERDRFRGMLLRRQLKPEHWTSSPPMTETQLVKRIWPPPICVKVYLKTMSEILARRAYEDWHENYEVDEVAATPCHHLVKKHLEESRDLGGKHVLEIGCGRGGFACWIARCSNPPAIVIAADLAHSAVKKGAEFAKTGGIMGIKWEVSNIESIAHP